MNNAKIMTKKVVTVETNTSIEKALELMDSRKIKELPVVQNKKYVGLIIYYDILSRDVNKNMKASDFMKKAPAVLPKDSIGKTISIMQDSGVGALPVIDEDKKVIGIVSDFDVLKLLINDRIFDSFKVEDVVIRRFPILRTDDTIGRAQKLAAMNRIDNLPIIDNFGKLLGQVSTSDILSYIFEKKLTKTRGKKDPHRDEKLPTERNIMEIAKSEIPKLNLTLNLRRALELMLSSKIKSGIVIDNNSKPVGILSRLKILDLLNGKNIGENTDLTISGDYDWDFVILVRTEINKREKFLVNSAGIKSIRINVKRIKKAPNQYQINMLAIGKKRYNIKVDGITKEMIFEEVIDKLDSALERIKD
ncbi:CBS domain-containing protein [Candidatus Parvarchaeota archaeon]|jgi:predicted transcriptional regulator|nr:CBS domain-containing protein [Candidatus Parvarchaeota archaeon]